MTDKLTKCASRSGRCYTRCECWPGDCICGYGDVTCEECGGEGIIDASYEDDGCDGHSPETASPPAPHVTWIEDGIERAARYIEKQRDDYVQEFGNYDPSTGVTEFSTAGEEYLSTLEELIDGIRALAGEAKP